MFGPVVCRMPVEFLSDDQVTGYGTFNGAPSPAELDKSFLLMMPTGSAGAAEPG